MTAGEHVVTKRRRRLIEKIRYLLGLVIKTINMGLELRKVILFGVGMVTDHSSKLPAGNCSSSTYAGT